MGHHEAQGSPAGGVLRSVRHPRHLLPLRRGLDRRRPRGLEHRHRADAARDGRARRPRRPPRRPRHLHDVQARRAAAGRPRRHPVPLQAAGVERQPLQRVAVQDREVLPRVPRDVRVAGGTPAPSGRRSSATTTTSTATPGSGCTPPRRSTTARPPTSALCASRPSTPPTPPTPTGSATADPDPRNTPPRPRSTSPHEKCSYKAHKPPAVSTDLTGSDAPRRPTYRAP